MNPDNKDTLLKVLEKWSGMDMGEMDDEWIDVGREGLFNEIERLHRDQRMLADRLEVAQGTVTLLKNELDEFKRRANGCLICVHCQVISATVSVCKLHSLKSCKELGGTCGRLTERVG